MKKRIAILGAGPAGLALAWKLLDRTDLGLEIKIIEKEPLVGGRASGFEHQGIFFDYGRHVLNPASQPEILGDIKALLGEDLLFRSGKERIRLRDRFVNFPIKPSGFTGMINRLFKSSFKKNKALSGSYTDVLAADKGKALCRSVYFPYARKYWGMEPGEMAPIPVQWMLADGSTGPGTGKKQTTGFYYPARGFIQIFDEIMKQLWNKGARFLLMQEFVRLSRSKTGRLTCILDNGSHIEFDMVFSTIPVTDLIPCIRQIYPENVTDVITDPLEVPEEVRAACKNIHYRSMLYCYLILNHSRLTPFCTHYFPGSDYLFTRVTEVKNFSGREEPQKKTGLCVEIPCRAGDEVWTMAEEQIAMQVTADLEKAGLPVKGRVVDSLIKRMDKAFPVYDSGLENRMQAVRGYLGTVPDLIVLGKQGLFLTAQIHQTMALSYRAAECLVQGPAWNNAKWQDILAGIPGMMP